MKKVDYYSLIDFENSPGVANKLLNTVEAFEKVGYKSKSSFFSLSISGGFKMLAAALKTEAEFVFFRYSLIFSPLLFFIICFLRLKGKKVIVDVPTPRCVVAREILNTKTLGGYAKYLILLCSGPWVLWPANRVIQYSKESFWFSFGLKGKTKKMGNGILVDKLPLSESTLSDEQPIQLVSVALIAYWHGYDRLLRALSKIDSLHPNKYHLTIAGDGEELENLKNLTNALSLKNVTFTGMLNKQELDQVYSKAHIGVSSLGLHRKGVFEAADLKTREYAARGLMILGSGIDVDFTDNPAFRLTVPCDESIQPIVDLLSSLRPASFIEKSKIREYAHERLSMEVKVKEMLSGLS
ncbi:glycosyltransferase [Pseudoalteromonas phenolica]|uniref:glycosyltransferase n=1 Tax=Pseudoalteromonas phenolica TaxID=161398 RepID=UPI00384C8382